MIRILEKTKFNDQIIYFLDNGKVFTGFELDLIDLQSDDLEPLLAVYASMAANLPLDIVCRIYHSAEMYQNIPGQTRKTSNLRFVDKSVYITFERSLNATPFSFLRKNYSQKTVQDFLASLPIKTLESCGLILRSLDLDYTALMDYLNPIWQHRGACLDQIKQLTGVLKITGLPSHELNIDHLYTTMDSLPHPYTYCVAIRKTSDTKAESYLRIKSNRAGSGSDQISAKKYYEYQKSLEEIALGGEKLIEFEPVFLFRAPNEKLLRKYLVDAVEKLRSVGETYIESFGAYNVFQSVLPGGDFHTPLLEVATNMPYYLPVAGFSTRKKDQGKRSTALPIHRLDDTLHYFDPFNEKFESYSMNIIGRPGTGKSVITNMITRSMVNDPNTKIFILDVGGSHSKNTENLGGKEYQLTTDSPSGLNPFVYVDFTDRNADQVRILSEFIETLIREENETQLTKDLRSQVEASVTQYLHGTPKKPSLIDFYERSIELPRRNLLSRWVTGGVFENCFKDKKTTNFESTQIHYFNFAKIDQALDEDFSQGGLAGILATFNLLVLNKKSDERYAFIADEVPIFIKRAFPFFALSIANIRKKGDAFITIAQRSEHLAPFGDTSILDNSPTKFIFSQDGSSESFTSRLNLTDYDLHCINNLSRIPGRFADCYQIDSTGKRTLRVHLSHEEYWLYTSKKEDQLKLEALLKSVPGLSMKEAIRCLEL